MEQLIIYELKVAASIAVFYAFYRLLLSRETLHRLNRIVLISTAVLSFILPLCVITIHKTVELPAMLSGADNAINQTADATSTGTATEWWWIALAILYIVGVTACLLKTGISVLGVYNLIRKGEINYTPDGSKIVVIDDDIAPCSWMNTIIMSREDFENGNRGVIAHEEAHIELGHSRDVLVVDILTAFQWFNPMMWMLRVDLRAVHEFEADDTVLSQGVNIKEYQYLLIKKAISESGYSVTNSFNHSILKNRITMMSKSKTNNVRGLRVLYILPLICVSLAVYAEEKVSYQLVGQDKDNKIVLKQEDSTAKMSSIKIVAKNGEEEDLNGKPSQIKIIGTSSKKAVSEDVGNANVISYEAMESISPDEIASMNVFKGEKAVEIFGNEKAAAGVIVIKLKTGEERTVYMADGDNSKKFQLVDATKEQKASKTEGLDPKNVIYVTKGNKILTKEEVAAIPADRTGSVSVVPPSSKFAKEIRKIFKIKDTTAMIALIKFKDEVEPDADASKGGVSTLMYNKGMDKSNIVYVVVDGDRSFYTTGDKINDFKAEEIESVNVHKDEAGIKKYTEGLKTSKPVEGVVVIKLKK